MPEKQNKDLETFIQKFEPNKYKLLSGGIEIRGITNIPSAIQHAKDLIQKFKLKLSVNHNADMTMYGGFEVKILR